MTRFTEFQIIGVLKEVDTGMKGEEVWSIQEFNKGAGEKVSDKADWMRNHIQKLYRLQTQLKR